MQQANIKIALIAAEDSADYLAAELISQLKKLLKNTEFIGIGGDKMLAQGLSPIACNKEFAIMGFAGLVKKLPKLLKLRKSIVDNIIQQKPDLFIGIDAPDLNFPIEKKLKAHGIKIIHYVSPSIWAWRPKRVVNINQITDLVLTLFPFEPEYYTKSGGKASYVGHPLAQNIPVNINKAEAKTTINLNPNKPVLAILPGSRIHELKAHTEIFMQTAKALQKIQADIQIISANTDNLKIQYIQQCADKNHLPITVYPDATAVLKAADFALLASGTVALEAMLCKTPMVVGYKISPLTYTIVKSFNMMLLPYYSLPNVLYGDFLVQEVLQKKMTVANLLIALLPLTEKNKQIELHTVFTRLHQDLLKVEKNAAQVVCDFLSEFSAWQK